MKSALVFLALVALSKGVPLTPLEGRIVNGEDAKVGEFPFQISLQTMKNFHFCGGSVLNENYVITAAHCVSGKKPQDIEVVAGTTNLNEPASVHFVTKIIVHAEYNPNHSWTADIALLKVTEPFAFSKTLSSVPLPEPSAKVPAHSMAVTSGWGSLREGGPSPTKLQRTNVLIADQEYCNSVNSDEGYPVYPSHICAYDPNIKTGPCHGDSGGPLTVNGKLVGLTSWTKSCASRKYPTVYTRVPEYIDWINSHAI